MPLAVEVEMSGTPQSHPADTRLSPRAKSLLGLVAIISAFAIIRGPLMLRQPGVQDEEYFAPPGWTILQDGVPRVPFLPSRNPEGAFFKADIALFALPPAFFYWEVPFYAVLGPSYGAARVASGTAGAIAVLLVFLLGRWWYHDDRIALWAAGLYSLSRVFFFPTLIARPDMLCAAIGLAAIACAWRWHKSRRLRWAVGAGGFVGLGLLTHPFAIVYALQIGCWMLIAGRTRYLKLRNAAFVTGMALAVFCLWLPLILSYPELFRTQFLNNVLDPAGPGLFQRFVWPWESLQAQAVLFFEHAGTWQALLMICGLLAATAVELVIGRRERDSGRTAALALAWSSTYLLIVCQGTHPAKGYWCYPAAFLFLCVARATVACHDVIQNRVSKPLPVKFIGSVLLIAVMLPGAGLRTWAFHVRHWSDSDVSHRTFVASVLADLPAEARYVVGPEFVFDFYLAGHDVQLALNYEFFFDSSDVPYDYLVVGRSGIDQQVPAAMDGRLLRTYGEPDNIFANYAEVFVPDETADNHE